jgi:predicted O-linked N-acetylglucosamine transferase (SPINDLY family)
MNAALAAEQVDVNRMIVINPLPHRQDVLAVLKLADVYLDAFPESGGLSIYDALEAGLPPVTMGSDTFRQVNGPIAESEQAYHDLAVKYANSPEERDKLREAVRAATVTAPPFLDVAAFGKRLTDFLVGAAKPPETAHETAAK